MLLIDCIICKQYAFLYLIGKIHKALDLPSSLNGLSLFLYSKNNWQEKQRDLDSVIILYTLNMYKKHVRRLCYIVDKFKC